MHPQMQQARKMELTSMLIVALEKINWTDTSKKEALEEALHNYDRFKPQEKALWVKERFSPKAIGQAFSSLYASVRP